MAVRGLGVDEGTATVKVVEVQKEDGAFVPVRAGLTASRRPWTTYW